MQIEIKYFKTNTIAHHDYLPISKQPILLNNFNIIKLKKCTHKKSTFLNK